MKRNRHFLFGYAVLFSFFCAQVVCPKDTSAQLRKMKYTSRTPKEAVQWQHDLRMGVLTLLQMDDLIRDRNSIPLEPKLLKSEKRDTFTWQEWEIRSTPSRKGRTFKIVLTFPHEPSPPYPAVVCIHGHGGDRYTVHDPESIYKGFATELARKSYVTISCDVGQHEVYERGRTLMGERLWDLIRCVDYLHSLPYVDKGRIGCAGLSLGGEMAMWLGAMDRRISGVVSSGFLTVMDQMEQNHCMCWKFDGLRELADFADIYSMTAPNPLQCQNGLKEAETMFTVPLARKALEEIKTIYADFDVPGNLELDVHDGGHETDLPALLRFFETHFK